MHTEHQGKILDAGFTFYRGEVHGSNGILIKVKTPENRNWHTLEKGFPSVAACKRRLHELDKRPKWVDLYDTKNSMYEAV